MLLHTANTEAATAEIESLGGRVTLLLGDDLVVAKVPRDLIAKKNSFASASAQSPQQHRQKRCHLCRHTTRLWRRRQNLSQLLNAGLRRHLQWPFLENPIFQVKQTLLIDQH